MLGNISVYSVSAEGDYYRTVVWAGHSRGGVASLLVLAQGTLLSAGDRDRRVVAWDSNRDFVVIGNYQTLDTGLNINDRRNIS